MPNLNKKLHLAVCSAVAMLAASHASTVYAIDPPNPQIEALPQAGQILQQIERDAIIQQLPVQPVIEEAAPQPEDQGPKVVVKQFKFEGNQVISAAELEDALESLTGQPISITQLKGAADLIADYYREKGFLATATLPEQDITEGIVIINIVEAIFGDAKVDGEYGKDYKRVRPGVVTGVVETSVKKGEVLNQSAVDKAMTVLQKMAGFFSSSTYQAGEQSGTTDVLVSVKDKPFLTGMLLADNTGARSTGRDKQTLMFNLASPLGLGDNFSLTGLHAKGVDYANLAYMVPVGGKGLQVGFNSSWLEYNVILKDEGIARIKPRGRSAVFGLDASYPLFTGKRGGINIEANYDTKSFVNQSFNDEKFVDTNNYKLNVLSLVLSGNYVDNFLAGSVNNSSINFANGRVNLNGSYDEFRGVSHKLNDYNSANTQGTFNRIRWNFNRNQFLTDTWVLSFDATRQWAGRNLDPSERLYLGGINGVRAYPTSEGAGSEGYLMKLELRKFLPYNFSASVFIDDGKVKQHVNAMRNDGAGSLLDLDRDEPNEFHLRGYGATLQWNGPYNAIFKAVYATRMGKNPNPATNQDTYQLTDQDGSLRRHVLWLSGSLAF
jgi:hemolysin activation/secretion protein